MENIQVMLFLARLFGCNSYLFCETKHGYVATLCKRGIVLFFINLFLYVFYAVENVRNPNSYSPTGSAVVDVSEKIILELGFLDILLVIVQRLFQSSWTIELLNRLRSIDRQLHTMGVRSQEVHLDREYMFHMLLMAAVTFCAIAYSLFAALKLEWWVYNWPMLIGHMHVSVTALMISSIFFAEVFTLRIKVRAINIFLRKQLCDNDLEVPKLLYGRRLLKVTSEQENIRRRELVSRVGSVFDEIHSISLQISNRYKLEFSGFCMLNILYGIMALFIFYRAIFMSEHIERYSMGIFLVWAVVYKLNLLQMVKNCHFLQYEGKETTALIIYASSQENDLLCNKKMHSLLCQMQQNPVKITTNFFDVNFNVIYAIIGAMSTYLFIMIQFVG